jgi:hypothetical protein
MRKTLIVRGGAIVALIILLGTIGASTASASSGLYAYRSGDVVVAFAGKHAAQLGRAYNSGFHGRRFTGQHGKVRCEFYSAREQTMLAILTGQRTIGAAFCALTASKAHALGFIRIK